MKAGVDEHTLQGRIRSWDGLIILHHLEVSPLPPIFCHPTSFISRRF